MYPQQWIGVYQDSVTFNIVSELEERALFLRAFIDYGFVDAERRIAANLLNKCISNLPSVTMVDVMISRCAEDPTGSSATICYLSVQFGKPVARIFVFILNTRIRNITTYKNDYVCASY